MKPENKNFSGIDFQKDYFSAVQYSLEEQAVTLISIQPFPAGKRIEDWKTWQRELKNGKPRLRFFSSSVACSVPAEYAVIKPVAVDEDEPSVEEALEWELQQHLIGSAEEYVYDFQEAALPHVAGQRQFLLVAYRRELVERTISMLRSLNFKPEILDLDILALINAFEVNYPEASATPCLLVHAEESATKLILCRQGEFVDFHCFENSAVLADEAAFASLAANEIDRFCNLRQEKVVPAGIYVTGSWFQQIMRRESFFEKVRGAEMLDPFRNVKCQVVIDAEQLREYATQLAVAVGLAVQRVQQTRPQRTPEPAGGVL